MNSQRYASDDRMQVLVVPAEADNTTIVRTDLASLVEILALSGMSSPFSNAQRPLNAYIPTKLQKQSIRNQEMGYPFLCTDSIHNRLSKWSSNLLIHPCA